jgi:hypothetical protein
VLREQRLDPLDRTGHAQVQLQGQAIGVLLADLFEVPAAACAQCETTAELVLAQSAFDHQDAVAGEQGGIAEIFLGEEGAFQPPAPILDEHEGLRVATLAHCDDLAGDHHAGLGPPAAGLGL